MSCKIKKKFCRLPSPLFNAKITSFLFIILSVTDSAFSEECKQINNCKCKFTNGSIIDLSSIGLHNEPRFKNMTPKLNESYRYYYNPCYPFTIGGVCSNVAVCQVSFTNERQNCGNPNSGFSWNSETNAVSIVYTAEEDRTTNVILACSSEAVTPKLEVTGEVKPGSKRYEMVLTSKCACPDLCHEDHLSAGSVLVILFMIFVSLYLVLGIIHSSLTRGAHGWELIPHYEFWSDFPLLVRDGCVFVMSGCKADTAYERI